MLEKKNSKKPVYIYLSDNSGTLSTKDKVVLPKNHKNQIIIANYENESSYWQF